MSGRGLVCVTLTAALAGCGGQGATVDTGPTAAVKSPGWIEVVEAAADPSATTFDAGPTRHRRGLARVNAAGLIELRVVDDDVEAVIAFVDPDQQPPCDDDASPAAVANAANGDDDHTVWHFPTDPPLTLGFGNGWLSAEDAECRRGWPLVDTWPTGPWTQTVVSAKVIGDEDAVDEEAREYRWSGELVPSVEGEESIVVDRRGARVVAADGTLIGRLSSPVDDPDPFQVSKLHIEVTVGTENQEPARLRVTTDWNESSVDGAYYKNSWLGTWQVVGRELVPLLTRSTTRYDESASAGRAHGYRTESRLQSLHGTWVLVDEEGESLTETSSGHLNGNGCETVLAETRAHRLESWSLDLDGGGSLLLSERRRTAVDESESVTCVPAERPPVSLSARWPRTGNFVYLVERRSPSRPDDAIADLDFYMTRELSSVEEGDGTLRVTMKELGGPYDRTKRKVVHEVDGECVTRADRRSLDGSKGQPLGCLASEGTPWQLPFTTGAEEIVVYELVDGDANVKVTVSPDLGIVERLWTDKKEREWRSRLVGYTKDAESAGNYDVAPQTCDWNQSKEPDAAGRVALELDESHKWSQVTLTTDERGTEVLWLAGALPETQTSSRALIRAKSWVGPDGVEFVLLHLEDESTIEYQIVSLEGDERKVVTHEFPNRESGRFGALLTSKLSDCYIQLFWRDEETSEVANLQINADGVIRTGGDLE